MRYVYGNCELVTCFLRRYAVLQFTLARRSLLSYDKCRKARGKDRIRVNTEKLAKLLGISRGTVSRVLNNHPNVKEETRRRVLQALERCV